MRTSTSNAHHLIGQRVDFTTSGALRAEHPAGGYVLPGRLNAKWAQILSDDVMGEGIEYVVYSYATPIAWVTRGSRTVRVVTQKFSVTTSKHQGQLYELQEA